MADLTREEVIEKVKKGESLKKMNLSHIDLSYANLSVVNLASLKFTSADLSSANLTRANLIGVDLSNANLISADLSNAKLSNADLSNANLTSANLIDADLFDTNLSNAKLTSANLINAILRYADLSSVNLISADLSHADLSRVDLSNANLTRTNLIDADLFSTNLSNANLRYADLSSTNLTSANLRYADLSNANLTSAKLIGADLSNANLRDTYLCSVDLEYASLTEADISGANIFHYKTHGWKIKGIKCTHVYSYLGALNLNKDEKEKSCRRFTVGEFVEIYKSIPTIDICFSDDFNNLDYLRLADIQEKIRLEMPDVGLRLKKMERKGFDMVVTLEVKKGNQLEDVSKKINELYKDKELEQAVSKALSALTVTRDINIEKLEVHMPNKIINTDGKGNIVNVDSQFGKSTIGHGATVNIDYSQNYFTNQVVVNEKFEELRKKVSEDQQKLIDTIVENLKKKQNSRAQNVWGQLKEGIKTSASAASILKTLADLLGFQ